MAAAPLGLLHSPTCPGSTSSSPCARPKVLSCHVSTSDPLDAPPLSLSPPCARAKVQSCHVNTSEPLDAPLCLSPVMHGPDTRYSKSSNLSSMRVSMPQLRQPNTSTHLMSPGSRACTSLSNDDSSSPMPLTPHGSTQAGGGSSSSSGGARRTALPSSLLHTLLSSEAQVQAGGGGGTAADCMVGKGGRGFGNPAAPRCSALAHLSNYAEADDGGGAGKAAAGGMGAGSGSLRTSQPVDIPSPSPGSKRRS